MKKRTIVRFTEEEKEYLIQNYPYKQTWELAEKLGVSKKKIEGFAYYYKLKKAPEFKVIRIDGKFNYKEADYILENFGNKTNKEIAEYLNCETSAVCAFARTHNLKKSSNIYKGNSNITPKQKEFILNNYANMPTAEICKKINLSAQVIQRYAFYHGIKKSSETIKFSNQVELTFEQKKYIIDNYSKMKNKDICNFLNIDEKQLRGYASNRKLLKDFNVAYKNDGYFDKCLLKNTNDYIKICNENEPLIDENKLYKSNHSKYTVNQNYFEKIDNEWKAYWLGFLYADGCIVKQTEKGKKKNSLSVCLSVKDEEHIEKFSKSIQSNAPIKVKKTNYKNCYCAKIIINNKKICEDLINLGCVPRKSLILTFPDTKKVPKELIRHFIRGYFDGDGCIHINKEKKNIRINFIGTLSFLTELQLILEEECDFRRVKIQKKGKAYSLQYGYMRGIENFYNYLYKNSNIVLNRKFEEFNSIFSLR